MQHLRGTVQVAAPVSGECAGLVNAESGGVAHRLARCQVADQIFAVQHSLRGNKTRIQT